LIADRSFFSVEQKSPDRKSVNMSMTLRRNSNPEQSGDGQPPEAEALMRRALGLLPSGGGRSRARSGDAVVVEHRGDRNAASSVNRVAAAEAALAEERQARDQLTRQLREAETALREAQTKRGHAELARDELLAALSVERSAREAAEEQVRQLSSAMQPHEGDATPRATRRPAATTVDPAAAPKRRGRPPGSASKSRGVVARKPEPESDDGDAVEWWVPGWQDRI
jgi:hypothetical protein